MSPIAGGTTTSALLSNEVKALYDADYVIAGQSNVYFDQFANLRMVMNGMRGQTYNFPIVESLQPTPTTLDELSDVTPQKMNVNEIVVTLAEYGGAVEVTRFLAATSYADVYEQAAYNNGYSMAESVDLVVRAVAGQGSNVFFPTATHNTRATLAGQSTSADRLNGTFIQFLSVLAARSLKMPLYEDGSVCAVIHPFQLFDLLQDTNIVATAQRLTPEIFFNGEVAYWAGMRLIVSGNAKGFYGAGAALASSGNSTLSVAAAPGNTSITVASGTNFAAGQWIAIQDAAETGNVWSDTNELFYITNVATNVLTGFTLDSGPGDTGGIRYSHPIGTVVNNNNSVWPVTVLGPMSITKAASDLTGPYGETVIAGPYDRLGRFLALGWYLIAGYGRTRNRWLLRGETGSATA